MNGTTHQSTVSLGTVPTSWSVAGSSDFNGDGKADILWQNSSTGQRVIWLMNGTTHQSTVNLGTVPTSWSIVSSNELNINGNGFIVCQNSSNAQRSVSFINLKLLPHNSSIGKVESYLIST